MHEDHKPYYLFTGRSRIDKAVNSLLGLVEGISIDGKINENEIHFLNLWLDDHRDVQKKHPFNELVPVVAEAIADGVLANEERDDILWLCERLRSTEFFDQTTADLQRLHAILGGIAGDGEITKEELEGLAAWLANHEHLRTCWPYDEVDSIITAVLADHHIDPEEHKMLMSFFSEFVAVLDDRTITNPVFSEQSSVAGVCAVCPEITFVGSVFCFTGASNSYTRAGFVEVVRELGGQALPGVSKKVNYLVIGAEGNPCWAYACYGRKVEKAVQLRKQGVSLVIVHENDFHDAVADG
ncbi:NAD-dependent DNA ligase [Immundisolibacter sp.]|uniref:NAD-dependent DNA ligase n=1 Tax=Immundisolibacter sp. TaxID=1934948 RepID=UPI0035645081